jgi:hypothetical protein
VFEPRQAGEHRLACQARNPGPGFSDNPVTGYLNMGQAFAEFKDNTAQPGVIKEQVRALTNHHQGDVVETGKRNHARNLRNRFRFNQEIGRTTNLPTVMIGERCIKQSAANASFYELGKMRGMESRD